MNKKFNKKFKKFIFCLCWFPHVCLFGYEEFDKEYKRVFGFFNNGGILNARL